MSKNQTGRWKHSKKGSKNYTDWSNKKHLKNWGNWNPAIYKHPGAYAFVETSEGKGCLAFDSCAVINMAKISCGYFRDNSFKSNKERSLNCNLNYLYNHSAVRYGRANINGKFVMCIVPAVLEEVDKNNKVFSDVIQSHLKNIYLVLEIRPEYREAFNLLTNTLMKEFAKKGLFFDDDGIFMTADAKIAAQAAIFNLPLISQDNHLTGREHGQRERIQSCIQKCLWGDHNGNISSPMRLHEFSKAVNNQQNLPQPENLLLLTGKVQKVLTQLGYQVNSSEANPILDNYVHFVESQKYANSLRSTISQPSPCYKQSTNSQPSLRSEQSTASQFPERQTTDCSNNENNPMSAPCQTIGKQRNA